MVFFWCWNTRMRSWPERRAAPAAGDRQEGTGSKSEPDMPGHRRNLRFIWRVPGRLQVHADGSRNTVETAADRPLNRDDPIAFAGLGSDRRTLYV